MVELEPAIAAIYAGYCAELEHAFTQVGPWWARLVARYPRKQLRLRWPGGLASHPRILAIYRDYHRRFSAATQLAPGGAAPRFDDDAAWGSDPEARPCSLIPLAPERLLIDRLQVEAPVRYREMVRLILSPVGVEPQPRPCLRDIEINEPKLGRVRNFDMARRHGVVRGFERLLGAAEDLRRDPLAPVGLDQASEFHRFAHYAYLRDLEPALVEAERWWTRALDDRSARGMSDEEAVADCYASHPIGPAAHARVLGVIQAYWAVCEEINGALPSASRAAASVGPEQLLLGWLRDGRHASWATILTALPYWPVGLDGDGGWV